MTLLSVFISRDAWVKLLELRMPPKQAYDLLKYGKRVYAEYELVEQQRNAIIRAIAGVGANAPASLTPGTPEHDRFMQESMETMAVESDLKPCNLTMGALLEILERNPGNALSPKHLEMLEPFLTPETP